MGGCKILELRRIVSVETIRTSVGEEEDDEGSRFFDFVSALAGQVLG